MKLPSTNQEGAAKTDAGILIMTIFFAGILFIAFTTNPVYVGIKEGDRAPMLKGTAYDGNSWVSFTLNDEFNQSWEEDSSEGDWYIVEFLDINCGYCKTSAQTIAENQQLIDNSPETGYANVKFLAVALKLPLQGSEYTRENVVAFRDNYGHNFPYVDAMDGNLKSDWKISGTPTYFLIKPNGVIAWASPEHSNEDVWEAYGRLVPKLSSQEAN
ncbi:MAG TPA: TlpA family protein disulfide reductase [Candidatus Poseidoniales archaeon]|nr:MAG TPA: TlpA family protein disulfide reductase [Candidatus Poseidoniales archaeon]HII63484.1 TlpA family protein disulfide reductase [Candidatus Poseidoniaceae archaeon]